MGAGLELISRHQPRILVELHGIYEALACAEILCKLNYQAILLTDQKTTLPILWAPREDQTAIDAIKDVLGHDPVVMFGSSLQPDVPATGMVDGGADV